MILLRNGTIVDGTGAESFAGDVLIEGDRIEDIVPSGSPVAPDNATEVIDATGQMITPGFIDCHAHSDAYLIIEPDAPSKISQGITTEINGQCGGSAAPRYDQARLSSDWAAVLGERLSWRSMAEYRQAVEAAKIAVNTVQFVGHNTLRASVVGYDARVSTKEELERMSYLLEKSLDEGGSGFSTGLIYQPGCHASSLEVESLAAVAAARGGFYSTHMKSEGDYILQSLDEVISLARKTGIRAEVSHLKTAGEKNWSKIDEVLAKVDRAVDEGLLMGADRYPFCAAGTDLDIVLPDWAQIGAAPAELKRLCDPILLKRIVEEINASSRDWSKVMIGGVWSSENKGYSGRLISELTDDPGEFVCKVLVNDGCKTGGFFFGMCEENLAKILSQPWTLPGSDASLRSPCGVLGEDHPHPRAYATMPEFYRRLRELGFKREAAIARMTSLPANRFELKGRGVLKRGAYADIAVIRESDFKTNSTYSSPHEFTQGVNLVMVNGVVTYRDGRFTGMRGGRFIGRDR